MPDENKLKAGVSGTQSGWTEAQRTQFTLMVSEMAIGEWHQGDCVGVDEQATEVIAQLFGRDILHTHPPVNPKKRAYVSGGKIYPEKTYLFRNDDIAQAVKVLFVIPHGYTELMRGSGTWYTYRQAINLGRRIILIMPDGTVNQQKERTP